MKVAVIGAGMGGLCAALRLARGGASVTVLEARRAPGGLASGFELDGFRFDGRRLDFWLQIGFGALPVAPTAALGRYVGPAGFLRAAVGVHLPDLGPACFA